MTLTLRDYQRQAIDDLRKRWDAGATRVPMVLATGLGKSVIFSTLADEWLAENPGRRVLVIAHTIELIEQAVEHIRRACPRRRVGVVMGDRNEVLAEIVVASRQTLASEKRRAQLRNVGMIVVDECHFSVRTNTYGKILEHFGAFDDVSPVKVAGFTATLMRSDKAKLSSIWEACTFSRDILFGIRRGYLMDVTGHQVIVPDLDLSRVKVTAGDFSDSSLGDELERTFAPEVVAEKYAELAPGRQGIAFWPLVATAYAASDAFNAAGIPSAVLHGELPKLERRLILKRFHAGEIQVIHNALVLTVGFDPPPGVDVVVIGRPTKSAPLYIQMVGRVLRPDLRLAPADRPKALILDITGASQAHGLRSLIDLSPERALKENPDNPDASLVELDDWLQEQLDADAEEARAGGSYTFESDEYRGQTATVAFDPLGRDKVWQQTPGGHWFMTAGGVGYVFLAPSLAEDADPGTFDLVVCSKAAYVKDGVPPWQRGTEHVGLPLSLALNWAEDVAMQIGGPGTQTLTKRKSAWRKEEPTEPQKKWAARLGIDIAGMTKGELSEAIDAKQASQRIDPLVAKVLAQRVANE